MNFGAYYCMGCHKPKFEVLSYCRGKMLCKDCAALAKKQEMDEIKKIRKRQEKKNVK